MFFCTHTGMRVRVKHVPLICRCPQRLENIESPGVTSSRELHAVGAAEAGTVSIPCWGAISPAPDFVFPMVLGNLQCFLLRLLFLAFFCLPLLYRSFHLSILPPFILTMMAPTHLHPINYICSGQLLEQQRAGLMSPWNNSKASTSWKEFRGSEIISEDSLLLQAITTSPIYSWYPNE